MTSDRVRVRLCDVAAHLAVCLVVLAPAVGQEQSQPNVELQREAMRKFAFLVGKWSGEARWFRLHDTLDLDFTEDVHYEQNGLVLRMDGWGRQKSDGHPLIGSANLISYDEQSGTYRIFQHPNKREGEIKVDEDWKGMTIDFGTPQRKTHWVARVNDEGTWTEMHWVTEESNSLRMFLQVAVRRQKEPPARKVAPPGAEPQEKTDRF